MRELLKKLRKNKNEELIEKLNYNQIKYNKYFDLIYKYIVENHLIDIIVELAVYDIPVGVNKDNIVVFEVRTSF